MKVYRGMQNGPNTPLAIEIWEAGEFMGLVRHVVKHSPSGMSVGYGGSGPADCARSLLIDALPEPWCPQCQGRGTEAFQEVTLEGETDYFYPDEVEALPGAVIAFTDRRGPCRSCFGERTSFGPGLYQDFKREVITELPQHGPWQLTQEEICGWVARHTK